MIIKTNDKQKIRLSLCPLCNVMTPWHGEVCLPCAIFGACDVDVSPALDLRSDKSIAFGVEWLSQWLTFADSPYYQISLSLPHIIIKHCEQVRNLRLSSLASGGSPCEYHVKNMVAAGESKQCRAVKKRYALLIDSLFARYSSSCAYCGEDLNHENTSLDTILPMHVNHSVDSATALRWYQLMHSCGVLAVSCVACNDLKTCREISGMGILRWWRNGARYFHPYGPPRKRTPMPIPVFQKASMKQEVWEPYLPMIHARLLLIGLRVEIACRHILGKFDKRKPVEVCYQPEVRTLTFGCPECTSGLPRIGWLEYKKR